MQEAWSVLKMTEKYNFTGSLVTQSWSDDKCLIFFFVQNKSSQIGITTINTYTLLPKLTYISLQNKTVKNNNIKQNQMHMLLKKYLPIICQHITHCDKNLRAKETPKSCFVETLTFYIILNKTLTPELILYPWRLEVGLLCKEV